MMIEIWYLLTFYTITKSFSNTWYFVHALNSPTDYNVKQTFVQIVSFFTYAISLRAALLKSSPSFTETSVLDFFFYAYHSDSRMGI